MEELSLKKLKTFIKKNGFEYELIQREAKKAIYAQKLNGKIEAFEVWKIKTYKYRDMVSRKHAGRLNLDEIDALPYYAEGVPPDNAWGRLGWTYCTLEKAKLKFAQLP